MAVPDLEVHVARGSLAPGRPVAIERGAGGRLLAVYDPAQISERRALAAVFMLAPGAPDRIRLFDPWGSHIGVITAGDFAGEFQSRILHSMGVRCDQELPG